MSAIGSSASIAFIAVSTASPTARAPARVEPPNHRRTTRSGCGPGSVRSRHACVIFLPPGREQLADHIHASRPGQAGIHNVVQRSLPTMYLVSDLVESRNRDIV